MRDTTLGLWFEPHAPQYVLEPRILAKPVQSGVAFYPQGQHATTAVAGFSQPLEDPILLAEAGVNKGKNLLDKSHEFR
jgi:hypothetical protein